MYRESSGNTGAPYATSRRLEALVDEARAASARFLGCTFDEVIFGANMTSLNFTLSRTLGRQLDPGDEIVVTRLDHDANVAPWLDLAADRDLRVRHADVHSDTSLDLADLERHLGPRTKVVAFPWAANSTGTIVDARAICDLAHQAGALAWVDAVQYAAHEPMDVTAIGADIVTCSAYKFCGPAPGHRVRPPGPARVVAALQGTAGRPSSPVGHRFETGTLPYELLGGLLATYAYLDSLGGMAELAAWERQLGERMLAGFPAGTQLYGLPTMAGRVPTFLINFPGVPSARLSEELADRGFGVWSHGSYYALGLHERIGWGEALRIGLAHYNTLDEMDRFNEVLATWSPATGRDPRMTPSRRGGSGRPDRRPASRGGRGRTGPAQRPVRWSRPEPAAPGLVRRLADLPSRRPDRRHGRSPRASCGSSSTEAASWRWLASLPVAAAAWTAACWMPAGHGLPVSRPPRTAVCGWTSWRCLPRRRPARPRSRPGAWRAGGQRLRRLRDRDDGGPAVPGPVRARPRAARSPPSSSARSRRGGRPITAIRTTRWC